MGLFSRGPQKINVEVNVELGKDTQALLLLNARILGRIEKHLEKLTPAKTMDPDDKEALSKSLDKLDKMAE